MSIEARHELPYPRNLRSLEDIEGYLKKLHAAFMAFQSGATEVYYTEVINQIQNKVIGTDNQIVATATGDTIVLSADSQFHITSATEQPYIKIINASDTARDPVVQFSVGATPTVKYAMGVDDSDSDSFKVCSGSALIDTAYFKYTDGLTTIRQASGTAYAGGSLFKHGDVTHGMTDFDETDTYLRIGSNMDASWIGTSTQGGPYIAGYSEGEIVFGIHAFYTTGVTNRSFPMAPFTVFARKRSGTGEGACVTDESIMTAAHGPYSSLTPDWTAMVGGGTWQSGINTASRYVSTVAIGTAPISPTSTTVCTNLNADLWDGYQFADYLDQAVKTTSSPTLVTVKLSNLTDGYVPYHVSDAAGLANSPIRSSASSVGIGAEQSSVSMLTLGAPAVPQWGGSTLYAWGPTRTVASNETNYMGGLSFTSYFADIASGVTDSGYRSALNIAAYIVDPNFKGTLAAQYGAYIAYGIADAGTSGERVITNSYGLYLSGMDYEGTITNKWGVYQVNTNFKNYFEGQIQSAVASGTAPLIVASTTAVTNLNADLLDGSHAAAFAEASHSHAGTDVELSELGTATYDDAQDFFNLQSSGRITGGALTTVDATHISVSAGTGICRSTASATGTMKFIDWSANTNLALTANSTNYIYVDYNSGSPIVAATTNRTSINKWSQFVLGAAYTNGAETPHVVTTGVNAINWETDEHSRIVECRRVERASGGTIATSGLKVSSTDGVFYIAGIRTTTTGIDTSGAGTFTYVYRASPSGWTEVASQTDIDNLKYDDGDGTLGTLDNNKYGVHWVYIMYDGSMYILYGQGNYANLVDAQAAQLPSTIPSEIQDFGCLAAKIIIKKSAASVTEVDSAYVKAFASSVSVSHNDLGGLQGGTTDEYYHLTSAEHGSIGNWDTAYGWGDHGAEGYLTSVTAHDFLSATHGDTTAAAVSRGAMIAGIGATPKWTAIAAGTEGYIWTMGATEPGWAAAAGGGAPTDAQYVCLAVNGSLSAERVLTGTSNQITITDNGANGTVVLSFPSDIRLVDGATLGQTAGPLLTFDDTNNYLEITGCKVGIGTATPDDDLQIYGNNAAMNFGTRGANGNWCRIKANADQGYAEFTTGFGSWWYTLNSPTDDARFVISRLAAQVVAMRGGYDGNQGKNITLVVQGGTYGSVDGANLYLRGGYSTGATQGQVKVQSSDGNTNYMTFLTDGKVGINDDSPAEYLDVNGNINVTGVYKVDDVQVVGPRVVDARCDDAINSGDATTDGVIDALRDAMIAHGLIAAS